jgi:hypothetical protein
LEVVEPGGVGGAVEGLGVPLNKEAVKEDLPKPMVRGVYAVSAPDQKTILKLRVFAREEAGFSPDAVLNSPVGLLLEQEVRDRVRSTWTILQLTFEAYNPELYSALDFMLSVAARLGHLTEGIVADPLSRRYRLPEQVRSTPPDGELFEVRDFVSVQRLSDGGTWRMSTAGLLKFDHPEILLAEVPEVWLDTSAALLLSIATGVMKGKALEPGDRLVSKDGWVVSTEVSSLPELEKVPMLEILPLKGTVGDTLSEWVASLG